MKFDFRMPLIGIALLLTGCSEECDRPLSQGEPIHVFDAISLEGGPFYVNDHSFIQGEDGRWHLYGIFGNEPFRDEPETRFVHAVSRVSDPAKWREGSFELASGSGIALEADAAIGETNLWAPHVIKDGGRYVMAYQSGWGAEGQAHIRLAESVDLDHWKRIGETPIFEDICYARDPMLFRHQNQWVMYYTRCESKEAHYSGVGYRTSVDLVTWSEPKMALVIKNQPQQGNSPYTESPFVFEKDGLFYLSVTAYPTKYHHTNLYRSDSPFSFSEESIGCLVAHAPEWIFGKNGELFFSSAGWGGGGVSVQSTSLIR